jgi:hypothetical protein
MTIANLDQLIDAMGNNSSRLIVDKSSIANAAANQWHSLWRATGQPGQGAIPAAAAVCANTTVGSIQFTQQTAPATSYLTGLEALCSNAGTTVEVHDRLVHMGGLNGTLTTAQTVGIDLSTLLATSNLDARKGAENYGDVQWWLEWYADTGGTAATATVNVTYSDASTGNLTGIALGTTRRASFMQSLNGLIPAADSGKTIRGVNSVTLSVSTGTAGSFGVTATRHRAAIYKPIANARFVADWADLLLPEVHNASCLFLVQIATTTSTGIVRATGKISHG